MNLQYIYLLQEREFLNSNENIYKIGKTKQENHGRFKQYPKNSILLFQMICDDCDYLETKIKKIFQKKYKQCKNIGLEYFEGDYNDMIKDIFYIKNNIIDYENMEIDKQIIAKDIPKISVDRKILDLIEIEYKGRNKLLNYFDKILKINIKKIAMEEYQERIRIEKKEKKVELELQTIYLEFLNEITEKTKNNDDYILISEVHRRFKCSDYYLNSSKEERRNKLTLRKMKEFIEGNKETILSYRYNIDRIINKKRIQAFNVLIGYKFINDDEILE